MGTPAPYRILAGISHTALNHETRVGQFRMGRGEGAIMDSVLLHSTGQTQVISRSQEGGTTQQSPHGESSHYNHCPPGGDRENTEQFQRK